MQNPRLVSELLQGHGKKLRDLSNRLTDRAAVLAAVRRAVPGKLAASISSAGIEHGRLTIGVTNAAWASRLRYVTAALRKDLGAVLGLEILSVRIRIVPEIASQARAAADR